MNRTDRLMAILLELQARREVRAEDLAATFEVSVRTIYRDVGALSESGVPIAATPGTGYRLVEGYFLPPVVFNETEAALLALGGEYVRELIDPDLRRAADDALRKLAAVLPEERRAALGRWREELRFREWRGAADTEKLATIRVAIRERRVLRLRYQAYGRGATELRDVEPFRLVHLGGAWHLAAFCRLREDGRSFRLDRMDAVEPLSERFTLGDRHRIERDRDSGKRGFPEARVRFAPAVQRWVREQQPYVFLHEEYGDTGPVFTYALRDEAELAHWLLRWGASVEVIAPQSLRRRLAAEARAVLLRHTGAAEGSAVAD